jgi:sodium-dependent dicarboxylate transporter 2/3/5
MVWTRRSIGLLLGPLLFATLLAAPTGLEPGAHRLAAIFALVIVFWVTEAIPLAATALLGPALAVPLGVASAREAFASFGHPILFLFLGSFLIARGMMQHGLDRRIALFVLSRSWVGNHPGRILLAFGAISWFLSMWISNTATTAMMLPVGLGVLRTLPADRGEADEHGRYSIALLLMIAFSCSIGGMATPVGTPPNLIGIGMLEEILGLSISFFDWMSFAAPISLVLFLFLYATVRLVFPSRLRALENAHEVILQHRAELGRWSGGERVALVAFLMAVGLWTLPGVLTVALGPEAAFAQAIKRALPEGPAAIFAAMALFVIPTERRSWRPALAWQEAAQIDWGTIVLFGGGLSLGSMAFSSGLAGALAGAVGGHSAGLSIWLLALLALFVANSLTEFMSNTATANLLIPIFLALAGSGSAHPALPAVAAMLGCSLAFCLPVATPPNAIVYGSGQVPLPKMIRIGILLDVGCGLLAWAGLILFQNILRF